MSLDGFIAKEDDDISWLSAVELPGEDYGYAAFTAEIDTYLIGRKTYDVIKKMSGGSFPSAEKYSCYVITRQNLEAENGVTFYSGNLKDLILELRATPGKDIYCDGGGQIVQMLFKENLIDEIIISVIPILLGNGVRLFLGDTPELALTCVSSAKFDSGLVQLKYIKKPNLNKD